MANAIILFSFIGLLVLFVSGGISAYINGEKGKSTLKGFFIGFFLPIIGIVVVSLAPVTDKELIDETYNRQLITKEEHEKTMEIVLKRK